MGQMHELIDPKGLSNVAGKLLDKLTLYTGWRTSSFEKIQGKQSFIDDVKKSNLNPIQKAAFISNAGKIIKEYANQNNIVKEALPLLIRDANPDRIDEDWITSFMDKARLISNNELQIIWANILAGESNQPGSYSMRTLEVLKNLNKEEAMLFQRLAKVVINYSGTMFIFNEDSFPDNGLKFADILRLEECGLISSTAANLTISLESEEYGPCLFTKDIICRAKRIQINKDRIELHIYVLNKSAQELFKAVNIDQDEKYFLHVLKHMSKVYENSVSFVGNPILEINADMIKYDETVDLII